MRQALIQALMVAAALMLAAPVSAPAQPSVAAAMACAGSAAECLAREKLAAALAASNDHLAQNQPPLQPSLQAPAPSPQPAQPPQPASPPPAPGFGGVLAPRANAVASDKAHGPAGEIRYGMVVPFSGANKDFGVQLKSGVETAFNAANDAGGVNGAMVRLTAADDGYDAARTPDVVKHLVETDKVGGFIGNFGTATAASVLPYVLQNRLVFFGAFSGADLLRRDPPDRYVFNYRPSYAEETEAAVQYLVKVRRIRPNQIAVFAQQDGFGDSGYAGVEKAVRALGESGAPNLRLGYQRNSIDVGAALAELKRHKNEIKAVVMVATYRAAAKFIEKTKDMFPGLIYTNVSAVGSSALAEELMLLGPRFAEGVVVTQCMPDPDGYSSLALEYKAALGKYFVSEKPNYVSFEGYVDGKILLEALRRAGPNPDSEKVVDAFENMHDVDLGLGVPISFGRGDHQAVHKVWGTQLDAAGRYQTIDLK